ncbi:MAG: fasciclin domain-containing protein [Anaerolineae bacterium]|nr:fasciclin domain-containing protein [Anaerolineae bacterium]
MLNNHPRDLLPFYINGTLTEAEQTVIVAHLAICPACQADLKEWQAIAQAVQAAAEDSAATLPPLKLPAPSTSRRIVPIAPLTSTKTLPEPENPSMLNHAYPSLLKIRYLRGSLALVAALILVLFGAFVLGQGIDGLLPTDDSDPIVYHTGQATLLGQTGTPRPTLPTAYDVLQNDPDLSQFAAAIAASGWLTNVTQSEPITIFVLPNRIFEPIQAEITPIIADGSSDWEGYLFSYVVNDAWSRDQLAALPPNVRGYFERGGYSYGSKLQLGYDANGALLLNGLAHITESIEAANGYVHILDAPLVTARSFLTAYQGIDSIETLPTGCDLLAENPDASYFKRVVDSLEGKAGAWIQYTICENMGTFTLFVPSDASMGAIIGDLDSFLPEAHEAAVNFVLAHLLNGLWPQEQLAKHEVVRSLWGAEGHEFVNTINARWNDADPHELVVNNRAKVTKGDVIASNGIIHYVDMPIVPWEYTPRDDTTSGLPPIPIEVAPADIPTTLADQLNTLMTIADFYERQAQLDNLWAEWQAADQIPYIQGDTVVFLYRGEGSYVEWRTEFNGWSEDAAIQGQLLLGTDLWIAVAHFPTDFRFGYRIYLNHTDSWIFDPANRERNIMYREDLPASELRMPDFDLSDWTWYRGVTETGQRDVLRIDSVNLGYSVPCSVSTPANYAELNKLPIVVVLAGQGYSALDFETTLDNLVAAGEIEPVILVSVGTVNPYDQTDNRAIEEYSNNEAFADFLSFELVPYIDQHYSTDARPERRLILGGGLGGQAALFTAVQNLPDSVQFGLVGAQSPSFDETLLDLYSQEPIRPLNIWLSSGIPEWDIDLSPLRTVMEQHGYQFTTAQANEGRSWNNWRNLLDDLLIHFFGTEERE